VCHADLQVPDKYAGKNFRCTACRSHFIVEGMASSKITHIRPAAKVRASALASAGALLIVAGVAYALMHGEVARGEDQRVLGAAGAGLVAAIAAYLGRAGVIVGLLELAGATGGGYWLVLHEVVRPDNGVVALGTLLLVIGGLWSAVLGVRRSA
jgi:hypothetical protein